MDWNHDGKSDWQDAALYNEMTGGEGGSGGGGVSCASGWGWMIAIAVIYYVIKLFA